MQDFAELIRSNLLIPYPKNYYDHVPKTVVETRDGGFVRRRSSLEDAKMPIQMAKERLLRKTTFWPMTISGSLLFPMAVVSDVILYCSVSYYTVFKSIADNQNCLLQIQHIDTLLRILPQDKMSDAECDKINQCIWSLMSVEARGELPSGYHKKGQKR